MSETTARRLLTAVTVLVMAAALALTFAPATADASSTRVDTHGGQNDG